MFEMKINWGVRFKNKMFWTTAIPAILLLIGQILSAFGVNWDSTGIASQLTGIVGTVFSLLTLIGVIQDPTTAGMSDSERALKYEEPSK